MAVPVDVLLCRQSAPHLRRRGAGIVMLRRGSSWLRVKDDAAPVPGLRRVVARGQLDLLRQGFVRPARWDWDARSAVQAEALGAGTQLARCP